ncbi:uncharacterized protein LOC120208849 [Hibiscus syriacus]|uniref:uncharacterized protein LOC120208849 n=1 Tax=Hibiscus syriacus TaxID=106335 RepID=UPI001920D848|nr:uncharacterized protein LOC120208849 [Hibiscus syriacus]
MQLPICRNLLLLKNSLVPTLAPSKPTTTVAAALVSSFHSTPVTCEKWKSKWNFDERSKQQTTKNYIRYPVHQKRADTKTSLKLLLHNSGCSKVSFQDIDKEITELKMLVSTRGRVVATEFLKQFL